MHRSFQASTFAAFIAFLLLAITLKISNAQLTDSHVLARKLAFELANAFANDDFKLRDGFFVGHLAEGQSEVIIVHLYAGNAYWFSAASQSPDSKIEVSVFDELGKNITSDSIMRPGKSAASTIPDASGLHYVRIRHLEGPACDFALLYSYK